MELVFPSLRANCANVYLFTFEIYYSLSASIKNSCSMKNKTKHLLLKTAIEMTKKHSIFTPEAVMGYYYSLIEESVEVEDAILNSSSRKIPDFLCPPSTQEQS